MFTIKRMLENGYDAMPCRSYRVEHFDDGTYIHLFEDEIGSQCKLKVQTVVYVENSDGKTVDRIYGKTAVTAVEPPAAA